MQCANGLACRLYMPGHKLIYTRGLPRTIITKSARSRKPKTPKEAVLTTSWSGASPRSSWS